MNKAEIRHHAKSVVLGMLNGRCQPEAEDVASATTDESEQDLIICEVCKIIQKLKDCIK
jgi:hypothetical protein